MPGCFTRVSIELFVLSCFVFHVLAGWQKYSYAKRYAFHCHVDRQSLGVAIQKDWRTKRPHRVSQTPSAGRV